MNHSLRTPLTNIGLCQRENTQYGHHRNANQHNRCLKI